MPSCSVAAAIGSMCGRSVGKRCTNTSFKGVAGCSSGGVPRGGAHIDASAREGCAAVAITVACDGGRRLWGLGAARMTTSLLVLRALARKPKWRRIQEMVNWIERDGHRHQSLAGLARMRLPLVVKARPKSLHHRDRHPSPPNKSAPASEVIAPPSNAATTSRPSTGVKPKKCLLHSVGIAALRE